MNTFLILVELICLLYQVYVYEETYYQAYRPVFSRIQWYLLMGIILLILSLVLSPAWYHCSVLLGILWLTLLYRKDVHWLWKQLGLLFSYFSAIGAFVIIQSLFSVTDLFTTTQFLLDLFLLSIAFVVQLGFLLHHHRDQDQMYSYPVIILQLSFAVVVCISVNQAVVSLQSLWIIAYQLLFLSMLTMYRFCFCLEISRYKDLIAMEQAYTMMGNQLAYETMQKENEYILKNLHDMKKQLRLLETLDDHEELQSYRQEIKKRSEILLNTARSGNPLIDHVLQRYQLQFYEASIQCNVESEDIDYSFMDPVDMSAVLCNLLDNAYESCLQCEERFILLKLRKVNDQIFWKMKNSMQPGEKEAVKDTIAHGFGLRNMSQIAQRYQGKLTCKKDVQHAIYTTIISFSSTAYAVNKTASARPDTI